MNPQSSNWPFPVEIFDLDLNEVFALQLSWAWGMRQSLRTGDTPKDVNSAKQLIQEHEEKWEDIQTHNDRYCVPKTHLKFKREATELD